MTIRTWKAADGSIRAECVACEGHGGADVTHPSGDPQLDRHVACTTCRGKGWREIHCDPLIELSRSRRLMRVQGTAYFGSAYRHDRARAMRPVRLPRDSFSDPLAVQAEHDFQAAVRTFAPVNALLGSMGRKAA